jgi:hypothetical protein
MPVRVADIAPVFDPDQVVIVLSRSIAKEAEPVTIRRANGRGCLSLESLRLLPSRATG